MNYNDGDNDPEYGKFYTRQEAQAIVLNDGWRLPSKKDFEKLVSNFQHTQQDGYVDLSADGVLQLMSSSGWRDKNGNNLSGFNALPAGYVYADSGGDNYFRQRDIETQFISSTNEMVSNGGTVRAKTTALYLHSEVITSPQNFTDIRGGVGDVLNSDWYRFSIRFVKDTD